MKNKRATIALVALVALATVGSAAADGFHGHRQGGMGLMALRAVLQPNQREQVKAIFKGEKQTLESLHQQLHEARQALVDKLLSSKQAEVSTEVSRLKQAEAAMTDEHVKIAFKIRSLFSPEQLAKASKIRTSLRDLRKQERALLMPPGATHEAPAED